MQILTYPVGVVVGLLPVVVELGAPPRPASLRLDGRTVCSFVDSRSSCTVDLGAAPKVHLLELVRTSEEGNVVERALRWVNRPGAAEAEVQTRTRCEDTGARCSVRIGWAHPERLNPRKVVVLLDGKPAAGAKRRELGVDVDGARGALLTVDMTFPDGRRATHATVLGGRARGDEGAAIAAELETAACGESGPADAAGPSTRSSGRGSPFTSFCPTPDWPSESSRRTSRSSTPSSKRSTRRRSGR